MKIEAQVVMNGDVTQINGGTKVLSTRKWLSLSYTTAAAMLLLLMLSSSVLAQGSIFGTVRNSDGSTPATGSLSFVGYLDDTDEEIRIESSVGAGYDVGNWFDDFQNYLTEAPGNPYAYHFANLANGEAFILNGLIPSTSFQQQNILLSPAALPVAPSGLTTVSVSSTSVVVSWIAFPGLTYHVYRRTAPSGGSFFRLDNPAGLLTDPGVATNYFVDNTVDGVSSYDYVIISENATGVLSAHSFVVTANSALLTAPVVSSVSPGSGPAVGGSPVSVLGAGFDLAGANATIGSFSLTGITVVSPFEITGITQAGPIGPVNITVTNLGSGLTGGLLSGYTYDANSPPVLVAIGPQSVTEAQPLTINISASDADGGFPILSTSALPGTATFIDSLNGVGTLAWTPTFTDAGVYSVTFYATDDVASSLVDSEVVVITVLDGGNQVPVLALQADTSVAEGVALTFVISATDADAEIPSLSATSLPLNATFLDNADGTGSFNFNPDLTQAGAYPITFKAIDAALAVDSIIVTVTVTETNQLPVLAFIGPQTITENAPLTFSLSATDGDGVVPVLSVTNLPAGAVFIDSLNGGGSFTWTPLFTDAGVFNVTFLAIDGALAGVIDSEVVTITVVEAGNQAPVLALINDTSIVEGTVLSMVVTAVDPDGTIPVLTVNNLPANATFVDNLAGSGTFNFSPTFLQDGIFPVSFVASDGLLVDSQIVNITVVDAGNVPPVITLVPDANVAEGQQLVVSIQVNDPDAPATFPIISVNTTLTNFIFIDNRNGTGTLTYNPDFFDAGEDTVRIFAVDFGIPQQTSISSFVITTDEINQPPLISPLGPLGVIVGNTLTFTVFATDSTDQDPTHALFLSVLRKPANAIFSDNGNGSGSFTFVPTALQAGVDTVTFLVVDQGIPSLSSTFDVEIRIVTQNIPPVLDPVGPQALTEGGTLNLLITASDPDGTPPTLEAIDLPLNAAFTPLNPGSAAFSFTPDFTQSGLHAVRFRAFDGIDVTDEIVLFQVYEAGDQAPVFDSIPAPSIVENDTLVVVITAFDPDTIGIALSIDPTTVPPNLSFVDSGNGVGVVTFVPDFSQAGNFDIVIIADDGTRTTQITVTIVVVDAGNQNPVLAAVANQATTELINLTFSISASDPDGDIPILSMISSLPNIPPTAFTDLGTGVGQFNWTPTDQDLGTYLVKFFAEDGAFPGIFDSTEISITVADTNRLPLIFSPGLQSTGEGETIIFTVTAVDQDGTTPFLGARLDGTDSLASGMTFLDNRDGTGTIAFTPPYDLVLARTGFVPLFLRFYAVDEADSTLRVDASSVTQINVQARNQRPYLVFPGGIGPFSLVEGAILQFIVGAIDSDAVVQPILMAEGLPPNATFSSSQNVGDFTFSPDFTQAGNYAVTFIAVDSDLGADTQIVQISVSEAGNQAPTFTTVLPDTINVPVAAQSNILVLAQDRDQDPIALSASPVEPVLLGGVFTDGGNGSGVYSYAPDLADVGSVFLMTFIASDGVLADTITTNFRVVSFLRGDVDGNNKFTMNDLVILITYLYRSGPAPGSLATADADGDGSVNILDITYLINFLYYNGPAPPQ